MRDEQNTDGVFVGPDGVKRRTLLAGAAWTIPVIAVATASPAMAASNDLTLAFDKSTYSGQACGEITGATVTATRNGQTVAGIAITVSLADGYTFEDGSTSYTDSSGTDGRIKLPAIKVPAEGGTSTMTATASGASTTAQLQGGQSSQTTAYFMNTRTVQAEYTSVPARATPVGSRYYLASNGDLYYGNNVVATNVSDATGAWGGGGNPDSVAYMSGGTAYFMIDQTVQNVYSSVPSGAKPVGTRYYLASNGDLYYGNNVVARDVSSAVGDWPGNNSDDDIAYMSGGKAYFMLASTVQNQYASVPSDAKPVGSRYYLASNGDLYYGNDVVARGVSEAVGNWPGGNQPDTVAYLSNGTAYFMTNSSVQSQYASVPSGSKPVGTRYYLASNGDLYYGNDVVAENVSKAAGDWAGGNAPDQVAYVIKPQCS